MPDPSEHLNPLWQSAHIARTADAAVLASLLVSARTRTLALLDAYEAALGAELRVPVSPQLNPPLWELGHIGWFQDHWIARNPQRALGVQADPLHLRTASRLPQADSLYNSSVVAHASRWHLPLPSLAQTRVYLQAGLQDTLALLASSAQDDVALYFYRLALFHENMHGEAAVYMAQALGMDLPEPLRRVDKAHPGGIPQASPLPHSLPLQARDWMLGYAPADPAQAGARGFAFDNELGAHRVSVNACDIDDQPVSWRRFLPFVADGGYADAQWWTPEGWHWRSTAAAAWPRYLRPSGNAGHDSARDTHLAAAWEHSLFGAWQPLNLDASACHLTYFEAQAWCRWAGRALPTEAQWECAAMTLPGFCWGTVWEWTASTHVAYPGFEAHPYRDYSAPWFGDRPVLRGACLATAGNMAHPRYRNYFTPERNDIYAGFRSCGVVHG